MNIKDILNENKDEHTRLFNKKLIQTKYEMLGIKTPILKNIAKELLKNNTYDNVLNNISDNTYEEVLLQGFIISYAKIDYNDRIKLIDKYIKKIDNWAICDSFVASLKFINKNKDNYFQYIQKYLNRTKEYELRFGIVSLLDYYIDDLHIDYVLNKMKDIKSDYYYVKMAVSWCLSVCLVKYFDKTNAFLIKNKKSFDKQTFNKALQKAIESFRLNEEEKKILKDEKYMI